MIFYNTLVSVLFQPVERWTVKNVLDWMAALNFCDFIDIFCENKITGADLLVMDAQKLAVSIKYHQIIS